MTASCLVAQEVWQWRDIGSVGVSGSAAVAADGEQMSLSAGGAGIGGSGDGLGFLYRTLQGDGAVVARLDALGQVNDFSKCGVMIRDGFANNARMAATVFSTANKFFFFPRTTAGGNAPSTAAPVGTGGERWLKIERAGDVFTSSWSVNGTTWQVLGSATIAMPENIAAGLVLTSNAVGQRATASFSNVTLTLSAPPPLPSPWQSDDVGLVNTIGSGTVADGVFTVSGGGVDISGTADAFHYVWQPLVSGSGGIVARLRSVSGTDATWTKAGLMLREDFHGGSRNAYLRVTTGSNVRLHWRMADGGDTDGGVTFSGTAPRWLWLERDGGMVRGYDSADGETWRQTGSVNLGLSGTVFIGLAVTAHHNTALATGVFDHVAVYPAADVDGNGIADWWEWQHYGTVGIDPDAQTSAGNGLTNLQAYQANCDPHDYYSQPGGQVVPHLVIVSGNSQTGAPNQFLAQPLTVRVTDSVTSLPLNNAPVTFSVTQGGGKLTLQPSLVVQQNTTLNLRTNASGEVSVSCLLANNDIMVSAVAGQLPPVNFAATCIVGSGVPSAPVNLVAEQQDDGSIELSWENTAVNATSVKIYRNDDGASWQHIATLPPSATSYTDHTFDMALLPIGVPDGYGAKSSNPSGDSTINTAKVTQKNNSNTLSDIAALSYAVIDLSGTVTGTNEVKSVALNDEGNAAFAYMSGSTQAVSRAWSAGALASGSNVFTLSGTTYTVNSVFDGEKTYTPSSLRDIEVNAAGIMFGNIGYLSSTGNWNIVAGSICANSQASDLPTQNHFPEGLEGMMKGYGDNFNFCLNRGAAYAGRNYHSAVYPDAYFICHGGTTTVFSNQPGTLKESAKLKVAGVPYGGPQDPFKPLYLNEHGWAAGECQGLDWQLDGYQVWDATAQQFHELPGEPMAMNNQGQVAGFLSLAEGMNYLWQSGSSVSIASLLPEKYRQQVQRIVPRHLGNADNEGCVRMTLNAETLEGSGSGTWVLRELMLRLTGSGTAQQAELNIVKRPDGWENFQDRYLNSSGMIATLAKPTKDSNGQTIPANQRMDHAVLLVPVEFVEATPALTDEDGSNIPNSTKPKTMPEVNEMVKEAISGQIPKVAYRVLKAKVPKTFAGEKVTWSMTPQFTPTGKDQPCFRGTWPKEHPDRFEAAPTNNYGFQRISQERGRTTIDSEGYFAARINLPPIGYNKARVRLEFDKYPGAYVEIDFEVPAVVVIDPGHGGTERMSGSSANNATSPSGVLEKNMTLSYGLALRDVLTNRAKQDKINIKVLMTRKIDKNISGADRAYIARNKGADVVFIIHFNASGYPYTARGTLEVRPKTGQVNMVEDATLTNPIIDAIVAAIKPFDAGANKRPYVERNTDVAADSNLGNTTAYHPIRVGYCEVEFIDNPVVDVLLNTGTNADAVKNAIVNAMCNGILDDLKKQPETP